MTLPIKLLLRILDGPADSILSRQQKGTTQRRSSHRIRIHISTITMNMITIIVTSMDLTIHTHMLTTATIITMTLAVRTMSTSMHTTTTENLSPLLYPFPLPFLSHSRNRKLRWA